jgi:hypothetical protein
MILAMGSASCNFVAVEKKPSPIRCLEGRVLEVLHSTQNLQYTL